MTIHVMSDHACRGPHDLVWDAPGAVVSIEHHQTAREILRQHGFSEVVPAAQGRHEAPDAPAAEPAADEEDGPDESDPAKPRRTRKTAVTE